MTETAKRLRDELAGLAPEERAEIAYGLIESLDAEVDTGVEAAWDAELARRADEIGKGEVQGDAASSVFDRVRAALTQ